jgi:hypothetical protein
MPLLDIGLKVNFGMDTEVLGENGWGLLWPLQHVFTTLSRQEVASEMDAFFWIVSVLRCLGFVSREPFGRPGLL